MEKNKVIIIVAVATFVLGLIFGSGFSGKKEKKKVGAKELLTQAIKEIDLMEKNRQTLTADLKKAQDNKAIKEAETLKEKIGLTEENNKNLQSEIKKLKGQLAHTGMQVKAKDELKAEIAKRDARIAELMKSNKELKVLLSQISSLTGEQEPAQPEKTAAEVSETPAPLVEKFKIPSKKKELGFPSVKEKAEELQKAVKELPGAVQKEAAH